jgi:hypothetical protein
MSNEFYWNDHTKYVMSTLLEQLQHHDLPYEVADVTYLNDTCPSLEITTSETQKYILFLPNSWRNDGEDTTKYMLIRDEDYGFVETYKQFDTLGEFINHLNNNDTKLL